MKHINGQVRFAAVAATASMLLGGCTVTKDRVFATTATVIGVQIHQKDADKTPEMKVGYARSEVAIVPTDKGSKTGSSTNSAEVLMEINAQGNVGLGTAYQGGVYQRLAVGRTAVSQPGAAFMMAKDKNGDLNPGSAQMVAESVKSAAATTVTVENDKAGELAKATDDGSGKVKKEKLDALVKGTELEGKVEKFYGVPIDKLKAKLMGSWRPYIGQMESNQ